MKFKLAGWVGGWISPTEVELEMVQIKAPKMTNGLAHIFCQHKVCKGFVSMTSAENPEIFKKNIDKESTEISESQ